MKKKLLAAVCAAVMLVAVYYIGFGFMKEGSAVVGAYSLSPDGSTMTLEVGVADSCGYIRAVKVHQQEGGKLYLDCYSAFGGVNGSLGAKSIYTIPLEENTKQIAFYRNTNCYETVLAKNADGEWERVK